MVLFTTPSPWEAKRDSPDGHNLLHNLREIQLTVKIEIWFTVSEKYFSMHGGYKCDDDDVSGDDGGGDD